MNESKGVLTRNAMANSMVTEEVDFETSVLSMPLADTSYEWPIPKGTKTFSVKLRDPLAEFRFAISKRDMSETTDSTDWAHGSANSEFHIDNTNIKSGNKLQLRSNSVSQVAEIIYSY